MTLNRNTYIYHQGLKETVEAPVYKLVTDRCHMAVG